MHLDAVRRPWAQIGEPRITFMPSYRLELEIGDLRHGKAPHEVMDAALLSLAAHHVDASDIRLIDGVPCINVRFTVPASSNAEEDAAAQVAASRAREEVQRVATTRGHRLLQGRHGRWIPIS